MEIQINAQNLESVLKEGKPVVVDFWATWCGPCRRLGPVIEELATEYDGKIIVGKCDIEENDELASQFGIMSVPTVLFFKNGQLVDSQVGAAPKAFYVEKINSLL